MTETEFRLKELKLLRDTRPAEPKVLEARIKQAATRAKAWAAINERGKHGKS